LLSRLTLDLTIADILDFSKECESRGLRFVQVSEQQPLPFDSKSFDFVFSNSVIEHVTLPKEECRSLQIADEEWSYRASVAQLAFAKEISRVGKGYFVQTPHPGFPIDLHMWLPLTNRLGHQNVVRVTKWTEKYWIKKSWEADWHLINPDAMRTLFPESRIHVERFWGMPKSLIAYKTLL
jgi:hypothetical protein